MGLSAEQEMGYRVFALVYQAGIANVFECRTANYGTFGRDAKQLLQSDFRTCEAFVRGLLEASDKSLAFTAQCNRAGDIVDQLWSENLNDAPFSNEFRPMFKGYTPIVPLSASS